MNKKILLYAFILVISISCSKKAIVRNYYLIELPGNVEIHPMETSDMFPYSVDVRDFRVAKAFEQTRMAVRTATNEVNYYYYHHWAVRPSYALADQFFHTLDQLGLFHKVNRGFSYSPNYLITGLVQNIERYHIDKQQSAHLAVTLQLVDVDTELPVVRYEFDRLEPLDKSKNMNVYAQSISEIFHQEILVFKEKIKDYLVSLEE